jgi:hypothetical protein
MPDRTTVVLPSGLKERAVARARKQGISFGEFVRRAVENQLTAPIKTHPRKKTGDPFLDNLVTFTDDGPPDLSTRIDEFLYGDYE